MSLAATELARRMIGRHAGGAPPVAAKVGAARALAGPGVALPTPLGRRLRAELDHDFSRVRVHADESAASAAAALGADAYTVGQRIAFAHGRYQPHDPGGQQLLRHELVHTMQQGDVPASGSIGVGSNDDGFERDAAWGRSARDGVRHTAGPVVQRQPAHDADKTSAQAVTADHVLPFAQGSSVRVSHLLRPILEQNMSLLRLAGDRIDAKTWELINLLTDPTVPEAVNATILESTPKLVRASIAVPRIEATGKHGAVDARTIGLELEATGTPSQFDLMIDWQTGRAFFTVTARRSADGLVLSTTLVGQQVDISLTPSRGGVVASTDHPAAKLLAGGTLQLIRIDPLTEKPGSQAAAQEQAVIAKKAAATATKLPSPHEVSAGLGAAWPAGAAPLLSVGWRLNYRLKGDIVTLPFGVQLDYIPGPEVTGTVLTGSAVGGGQLRFPVGGVPMTLSFVAGARAGAAGVGSGSASPVLGPVGGLRASVDVSRSFRVYVGAEYFRNVLSEAAEKRDVTGVASLQAGTTLRF